MRSRRARALLAAVLVFAAPAGAEPADRTLAVYEPRHRSAQELLPLARVALGGRGEAMLDPGTNSLVLVGPRGALAETIELLQRQDRALRTLVLSYESRRLDSLEARGVRVDWTVGAAGVRVGNVVIPESETGVRVGGFSVSTEREGGFGGVVRILEGQAGRIGAGASVPVTTRSLFEAETTWVSAESGFEARPRILGDGRVQVELVPVEASVDRRGRVRFSGAATTVTLRPGETIAVGGIERSSELHREGTRTLRAGEDAREERVLLLSVRIEGAAPDPASRE